MYRIVKFPWEGLGKAVHNKESENREKKVEEYFL